MMNIFYNEARLQYYLLANKVVQPTAVLTVDDTSKILGVKESTVRVWIRQGKIQAAKLSGDKTLRIIGRDLLNFVQSKKRRPISRKNVKNGENQS